MAPTVTPSRWKKLAQRQQFGSEIFLLKSRRNVKRVSIVDTRRPTLS
jgi:hypothetical protein